MKKQTRNTNFWGIKSRDKVMPNKLFADSDRDGVPNVFDCRPFNKRRQDEEIETETEKANREFHEQKEARRKYEEAKASGKTAYKHYKNKVIKGRGVTFSDIIDL